MIRILLLIALSSCILIAACATKTSKSLREGAIRYKITYSGNLEPEVQKLMPQAVLINFKNDMLRFRLQGGLAELKPTVIINGEKAEMTTLKNMEHLAEIRHLLTADTSLVDLKKTETIAGYSCRLYKASNKNTKYQVWVANDIPFTLNGTSRLEGFYLSAYHGLPLKVIDHEQDFTMNFEADSISKAPQADSLFTYPKQK